ncbi:MAG: coenzyme F420-0:L-glutamate ligase, partial [Myxococcota bacterium]
MTSAVVTCARRVEITALDGLPIAAPGDDLAELLAAALERTGIAPRVSDVLIVASTLVSRAEDRFVDVSAQKPSPRARELAAHSGHDPRLVELILGESRSISRVAPGVLIVRHRLGFVSANAGIDLSNAAPPDDRPGDGPWALLMPR